MTLLDYYADEFSSIEGSPLRSLIGATKAFSFDKEEVTNDLNLKNHVALGENVDTSQFLNAFVNNNLNNIVQTSNDDLNYELFIASIILNKPKLFLNNPLTVLNSKESSVTAMNVWQENFNSSEHKSKVLDGIKKFASQNKSVERLSENILIIIDEIFSNALFNAPVDDSGYRIYKNMPRDEKVKYPGNKNAKIFAIHTNKDLFIGCIDPWGSIDRDGICKSLNEAYTGRVAEGKGAGLGLRMMLDRSRSIYLVSEAGQRTLICCHMRLNVSLKKVENVPKQLHINCFG